MSEKEIRITAADADNNGKADSVIISFYENNKLYYAVRTTDKDEDGFAKIESHGIDINNDGKLDDLDSKALQELANIALKFY